MHTEGVQLYRVATLASKSSEADKPALDNQHLNVQYNNLFKKTYIYIYIFVLTSFF